MPGHRDSRRRTCKDRLPGGKTLRLSQLWPLAQDLPLKPNVHVFNSCYLSLTVSGHHFSVPVWLTPIPTSFLQSGPCSAPCHHGEPVPLNLPFPTLTKSSILLLFHSPSSTICIHPLASSIQGFAPAMLFLDISPSLSTLSSLQLGPRDPHLNPSVVPPISTTFFRQNPNPQALCLHLLLLLTKLLWSYYQNKTFFRKLLTKSCTLVPIDSHAVMMSGLHWVFHTTVSLSFIHHPLPAFILLYKVLP